jgi:hypothetical protein
VAREAPRTPRLAARIRRAHEMDAADRARMFRLYEAYYEETSFERFASDLAAKTHVIELRADGELRGFSTAQVIDFDFEGAANRAIFSGDTIIDAAFWGEQALVDAFCRLAGQVKARAPAVPLYWFLISKGYRTYRYLGVFAHEYFPHPACATPGPIAERLHLLARGKFGAAYDSASGLIRFPRSMGHLRPRWAEVGAHLREHAAVRFFLERNPRYHAGEELACITELASANLRSFARRSFLQGLDGADTGTAAAD